VCVRGYCSWLGDGGNGTGNGTLAGVELEISENQSDVFFNFNEPFEIHDYSEVLRRMGMHRVDIEGGGGGGARGASLAAASEGDLEARKQLLRGIVPEHLVEFVPASVFEANTQRDPAEAVVDAFTAAAAAALSAVGRKDP
jgi:hypothetical protein